MTNPFGHMAEGEAADLLMREHGFLEVTTWRIRRTSKDGYLLCNLKQVRPGKWATVNAHGGHFTLVATSDKRRVFMAKLPTPPDEKGELMELVRHLAPTRGKFVPVRGGTQVFVDDAWVDFPDYLAKSTFKAQAEPV